VSENNASDILLFKIYVNTSKVHANKSIIIFVSELGYNWSVKIPDSNNFLLNSSCIDDA
jgi:hypothetical protein